MNILDQLKALGAKGFATQIAGRLIDWEISSIALNGVFTQTGRGRVVGYQDISSSIIVDGHKSPQTLNPKGTYKGQLFTIAGPPTRFNDCGVAVIPDVDNNSDGLFFGFV